MAETGTTSTTVIYTAAGHRTVHPPPVCDCGTRTEPMIWLCGGCGQVHDA